MPPRRRTALIPAPAVAFTLALALTLLPAAGPGQEGRPANRLAQETSPYLLLHAHNPVDWYPWGPEAFAKAKAEGKPVFLSVGYSSCYWCHVMERECFENPGIAKLLNASFVCVKVDREERPDVDEVYMAALQAFGRGGWPMSMFLTPDGRPFFGGTYFPPDDRDGLEGFPTLLGRVTDAWRDHRKEIEADADRLAAFARRALDAGGSGRHAPLSRAPADAGAAALAEQFDPEYGGFGFDPANPRRPKFPEPVNLAFLMDRHRRGLGADDGGPGPLAMVTRTLDRMARGGVRDQLAGGYHRYSTDRSWTVPHFEKMLYDNAQLASALVAAFELTGDPRWRDEAAATFAFVARTMTGPEGGFHSALDAETDGEEGAFYVWTRARVREALGAGPGFDAFARVYGLDREPNFADDRYVLLEPLPRAEQAAALRTTPGALEETLGPLRARLLKARDARPSPRKDDKVLTSWNGLMIAAYADGHRVLKDPAYRAAAEKAADFLWGALRAPDGRLLRTYRAGRAKLGAYLEDYACLAHGLLRLHAATGDPRRLAQARALTDRMLEDFADEGRGGFFSTADGHESLLARPKNATDGVLPSGNSVAVRNLVALAALTGEPRYLDAAGSALAAFSGRLAAAPGGSPLLLVALQEYLDARPGAAVAAAEGGAPGPVPPGPAPAADEVVTVSAGPPVPGAGEGRGTIEVPVTLKVRGGWHVFANPVGVEGFPPTRLTLDPGQGLTLLGVEYPPGVARVLGAAGADRVALYEGTVTLRARLAPAEGAPRPERIRFTVAFQACDDRACLAPARRRVTTPAAE